MKLKKPFLLKIFIDCLILFFILGLFGRIINIPLSKCIMSPIKVCIVDWNLFYWAIAVIGVIASFTFLKSLFHLRKMVKVVTSNSFSDEIIADMYKSGVYLNISGFIYFFVVILLWTFYAYESGEVIIGYDMDLIPPLFIMIIGMLFMKVANYLNLSK